MAAQHLTTVPLAEFPQVLHSTLQSGLDCEIQSLDRLVARAFAHVHLTQCFWSDEHCDCRQLATVHDLHSEQEFCLRHFAEVEKRRG
jgi:hypothetical protein